MTHLYGTLDNLALAAVCASTLPGGNNVRQSIRFLVRQDTKTLLVTDMVVKVEDQVPEIVCEDPRPLLFHARDNALERVEDTPEVRLKGWRRIVQVGRGP